MIVKSYVLSLAGAQPEFLLKMLTGWPAQVDV